MKKKVNNRKMKTFSTDFENFHVNSTYKEIKNEKNEQKSLSTNKIEKILKIIQS